jgi:hypothetical protein
LHFGCRVAVSAIDLLFLAVLAWLEFVALGLECSAAVAGLSSERNLVRHQIAIKCYELENRGKAMPAQYSHEKPDAP